MLYARGACYNGAGEGKSMIEIRPVQMSDAAFWRRLDLHISAGEFERKVRDGRGYVLLEDGVPAALMRYNLF